jgi:hypothetical protein
MPHQGNDHIRSRASRTAATRRRWLRALLLLLVTAVLSAAVAVLKASGGNSALTFAAATSYIHHRPRFRSIRTIRVTAQRQLAAAIAHLRPGDQIEATTGFKVSGEFVIAKRLAAPGAVIDLGEGENAVHFDYGGTANLPSVWIHDAGNIQLYGGDVTNPSGGTGIAIYGQTSSVVWWGFSIHDTAGAGLTAASVGGPIDRIDVEGSITRWGLNFELDPHAEKGTGTHAVNISDIPGGVFTNNRVAIHAWDGPGDAIEIGNPDATGQLTGNTLILRAEQLTFRAEQQVAGNGLQLWGGAPIGANVPYLVTRRTQGRAVDANGVFEGVSMAGVIVAYGRATACCLNPHLHRTEPTLRSDRAWDPRAGVTFLNVVSGR